ncbi:MAG: transcription initiation factor IIB [Thermoplasmataceae archaeon]|jgi:transcription initiation factor TFIIB|nr:transcription initiation factor IIB [Candidatus Thermoplasmatota archaeon]
MVENEKIKKSVEEIQKCPECGSTQLVRDYERGELICNNCGIVIDESFIDQGAEWRAFDSEQNDARARTGSPMTFTIHDKGLSTDISWKNKDSYGKSIPTRNRAQLYRLRKWQKRIKVSNAAERNLSQALQELERMASNLSIPKDVWETAAVIYRKAVKQNMIRGRSIEGVVAGSIYAACRITNVPRTLDEIATVTRVKKKEIGRTYRIMSRYLKLNIMPSKPEDYINRFCSKLKLSMEARKKGSEILKSAEENDLISGKGPTGVAAAAIYIASLMTGERRTQRAVAEVAGVTEVTIRNRYKELTEKLSINVEDTDQ